MVEVMRVLVLQFRLTGFCLALRNRKFVLTPIYDVYVLSTTDYKKICNVCVCVYNVYLSIYSFPYNVFYL